MVSRSTGAEPPAPTLGPALVRAWLGYRRRILSRVAAAGLPEDRWFPESLLLRLSQAPEPLTVSDLGRELDITRQGASKLVAGLRLRGYVTLQPSPGDAREKAVVPTRRAIERLAALDRARREVEDELRAALGDEAVAAVYALAAHLDADRAEAGFAANLRLQRVMDGLSEF